jgi:putative acetyltransferase
MFRVIRTDSTHLDFILLVKNLDQYLAVVDGDDHAFYHQYNGIDILNCVVLVYENDLAVGCGAIKPYSHSIAEVKRMWTSPEVRGRGIAKMVLAELENWSKELTFNSCILETGIKQVEAISLYYSYGYSLIENYGQYAGVANSLCFEKKIV